MYITRENTAPTLENALKAVAYKVKENKRIKNLIGYYDGEHDIINRKKPSALSNVKVVVNHAQFITDIATSYLLGNPVEYALKKDATGFKDDDLKPIMDMYQQQDIGTIDFEVATDNGVSGIMYELEYADENNQVLTAPVDADTCVIAYDDSVQHRKLWAIIFKTSTDVITTDNPNGVVSMQVYTATQIIKYENSNKKLLKTDELPHYFTKVPVVRFRNNRKETGDFEKVIGLIDAYNLSLSDRVNDKVQLVEAILVAYGFDITKEQMQAIKDGRLLTNLPKPQDAKAEFLVKQLNETDVDILRRVLADDIHKISMIPNITDKEFAGNSSGVALKFKLLAFEQVVLKKERYFEVGLLERFELYNIYLAQLKQMPLIPKYKIDAIFKRNLPQNDYEISQTIVNLDGKVDDVTLVGQLSFVEDAQATVELAQKQAQKKAVESAKQFGLPVNGADPMQTKPTGDNNADDASVE